MSVVDDGSTDHTVDVLKEHATRLGEEQLRVEEEEHRGAWAARNRGLEVARGEYIQFLDSDDYLAPNKIEAQVRVLEETGCAMALCDYQHIFEDASEGDNEIVRLDRKAPYTTVTMFTPLLRRESIPDDVRFQEMPRQQYDDQDFLLRFYLRTMNWVFVPEPLCYYVHHGGDQITDKRKQAPRPWFETFHSLYAAFAQYRAEAPGTALDLVWNVGLGFAKRLLHKGMRREARSICRRLLADPHGARDSLSAFRVLLESFEPRWLFSLTRAGRRRGRQDPKGAAKTRD